MDDRNPITKIDAEEFEAAQLDPRVHEFWRQVDAYAEELIVRGHCRCHLLIVCPDRESRS